MPEGNDLIKSNGEIQSVQALTRARFSAGDAGIGRQFEAIRIEVLRQPRDLAGLKREVIAMRQKMADAHANKSDLFDGMFDAVVISGRVGMRKPEPEIFHYTCSLLGLAPRQCVFVDDLKHNIEAADRLGFSTVHHLSYGVTASELSEIFGRDLNR